MLNKKPIAAACITMGKGLLLLACCLAIPVGAGAVSSNNFRIEEDFVGGGGGIEGASPNYKARDSIGAAAVGDAASGNFRTQSGATTTDDPELSLSVDTNSIVLGSLSTSITRTGSATFNVLNYTSYGYSVYILGSPPTNGSQTLAPMTTAGPSQTGTEQFGMNVVANTSPSVGADPLQVPDNTFGFGAAAAGYNTANTFKYVSGQPIATATKSSGLTTYTASYIANVSNNTAGGRYIGRQTFVVVGGY